MDKQAKSYHTLVQLLTWRAETRPDKVAFTFLKDGVEEEEQITFKQLHDRAKVIAGRLQANTIDNPTALLLYPQSIEHMCAFWGCVYAGVRAVPLYLPQNDRVYKRIRAIKKDCGAQIVLCDTEGFSRMSARMDKMEELSECEWIVSDEINESCGNGWRCVDQNPDTVAYYQYTSGSTGMPKGVMVSHGNAIYNLSDIDISFKHNHDTVLVSWLPIFHDMGLIYGFLQSIYNGFHTVLMSPNAFAQRPYTWLKAITDYKATHSGGPNSAFIACVEKILPEQKKDIDLSSLRVLFNGAEPVREVTLRQFAEAFSECGFHPRMYMPCYGLAEATLKVTTTELDRVPNQFSVDVKALERSKVVPAKYGRKNQTFVSSGITSQETEVMIVDPVTREACEKDDIGEIWVKGPTNTQGYYRKESETKAIFDAYTSDTLNGPYMRTGDLGFMHNNELYIAGRLKDLVIIRGRNFYPQDIEEVVELSHSALAAGGGAAFSLEKDDEEQLVVVHAIRRTHMKGLDYKGVFDAIRRAVAAEFGVKVSSIQLLMPASAPRTTSGKIQRRACKSGFIGNTLSVYKSWSIEKQAAFAA